MSKVVVIGIAVFVLLGGAAWWIKNNAGSALVIINQPDEVPGENGEPLPFTLPAGFAVHIFAKNIPGARVMTYDPTGTLIVSQTDEGKVSALPNRNTDNVADQVVAVIEGLSKPHGILFHDNKLYVAETDKVSVFDYNPETFKATNKKQLIDLPTGGGHSTRSLYAATTPRGERLFVTVGSSCNVCIEQEEYRAAIISVDFDGSRPLRQAWGLRNSVFMTTHPVSGAVWATEMGRDLLGDNLPPDEINIIEPGGNYGWPYCYGKNIRDTTFTRGTRPEICQEPFELPSHIDIPAHSAPLGLAFIPEEGWPEDMWFDLLVAYHGSWNRSTPTGYKIVKMDLDKEGNYKGVSDFMTGFLPSGQNSAIGRPVDILVQPGGTIYVSDDHAGLIYQIRRTTED